VFKFIPRVVAALQPWDHKPRNEINPERVRLPRNPFRVIQAFEFIPRVVAALQPWAAISQRLWRYQLANAFGVIPGLQLANAFGVILSRTNAFAVIAEAMLFGLSM